MFRFQYIYIYSWFSKILKTIFVFPLIKSTLIKVWFSYINLCNIILLQLFYSILLVPTRGAEVGASYIKNVLI